MPLASVRRSPLILHAPNVHTGGGLRLLTQLLACWPAACLERGVALLDRRARSHLELPGGPKVLWVDPGLRSRWSAERELQRLSSDASRILCFNGLPPLLPVQGQVAVYVQNRLLVDGSPLQHAWRTRLRITAERAWFRSRQCRAQLILVQTASMARAVQQALHESSSTERIRIRPFADLSAFSPAPADHPRRWDFVYVADASAHKNHRRLVEAWLSLAEEGLFPSLALTLSAEAGELERWIHSRAAAGGLHIELLGHVPTAEMADVYRDSRALVYPSLVESFGLPLLEAAACGLPIVGSELDYLHDVCTPAQTFDPNSVRSIARAIKRHVGVGQPAGQAASDATAIWGTLLQD